MAHSPRHIPIRSIALLLALLMAVFPAAASGLAVRCGLDGCGDDTCAEAVDACCAKASGDSSERDDSAPAPAPSKCLKCMQACCRVADLVHLDGSAGLERIFRTPLRLPAPSVHDALACKAIFHPPRV